MIFVFIGLLVILAGVRFSDGSMLLAISRGATIEDSVFRVAATQYVWDSPLKIMILRLLPAQTIPIALFFLIIGILPILSIHSQKRNLFWLTLVVIFLTPALKISVQNIGVGDGLIIFLIVLAVSCGDRRQVGVIFFLIGLWHPQQSFFIGLSFVLGRYVYEAQFDKQESAVVLGSLLFSALIFLAYKSSLGFIYAGRGAYIVQNMADYLGRNIIYAPVAFLPSVLWFIVIDSKPARGFFLLLIWLLILGMVSLLTLDVTRVMTIISLPLVLMSALRVLNTIELNSIQLQKLFIFAIVVSVIPVYSWSGLDFFLWGDLMGDFCKWRIYCL